MDPKRIQITTFYITKYNLLVDFIHSANQQTLFTVVKSRVIITSHPYILDQHEMDIHIPRFIGADNTNTKHTVLSITTCRAIYHKSSCPPNITTNTGN